MSALANFITERAFECLMSYDEATVCNYRKYNDVYVIMKLLYFL